ncbi:MAG TPA: glycerol acyltransferase [Bacteroidetes bacterium]|nr:glycerol acyltransferase [Bacteroidota bacterium]
MADIQITKKTIDLKKVFKDKSPKVAKFIPGFVYSYLRKLVHEDEANEILYENRDKYGLDFLSAALKKLNANIKVFGLENIPETGKVTLISNHPLGGFDGMALMDTVGKVRKDFFFLANDILMVLPNLNPLFVPVNKHGSNQEYREVLNNTFSEDNLILIFPAGMVSRKIDGKIQDLDWKYSFLTQSKRNKRDILPVFVEAQNSNRFYNIANWRKKLGIKINIEMFFLVDELFKFRNKEVKIFIGKPISYKIIDDRFTIKEWALIFRKHVYSLKDDINKEFEPVL